MRCFYLVTWAGGRFLLAQKLGISSIRSSSEIFLEPSLISLLKHISYLKYCIVPPKVPQISFYCSLWRFYFYVELRRQLLGVGSHHVGSSD